MLRDEAQDHFARHRRELRCDHFAEVALYMIFGGVTHAAMGSDGPIAGVEPGIGSQVFRGIGLRAARYPAS